MKKHHLFINFGCAVSLSTIFFFTACAQRSRYEKDAHAGMNGGFEVFKNDLPVNWNMYSPETVPNASFRIASDSLVFKEGRQSLRFDVEQCSGKTGYEGPGFTNEFIETGKFEGEARVKLSFWVRNQDCAFVVSGGAVSATKGEMLPLLSEQKDIHDWKKFEFEIDVPKGKWLRMQLNIAKPGTLWVDDVKVERL